MERYLIKVTYLEGTHKGKTYLMQKGGYITDSGCYQWDETTYANKAMAERRCKQLDKENVVDCKVYKWVGREAYEPYKVPENRIV